MAGRGDVAGSAARTRVSDIPANPDMETGGRERSQTRIAAAMGIIGTLLLVLTWTFPEGDARGVSIQQLVSLGVYAQGCGLVAAVWGRRWLVLVASAGVSLAGVAILALLTVWPHPGMDPMLKSAGLWTQGPVPLAVGWSRLAMGMMMVGCGLTLPRALDPRPPIVLATLTLLRLSLWTGSFWLVCYQTLDGRIWRLVDRPDLMVFQGLLVVLIVASGAVLLRGDRRWMGTLTGVDHSVSMARYILPVALAPVLGGYVTQMLSKWSGYPRDVAPLLDIEITAVVVVLLCTQALKTLWAERSARETLARTLQASPVIVHSAEGRVEYWPRGCETLYGYTAGEAKGQRSWELLKSRFPQPLEKVLEIVQRDGEWAGEVRQTARDGRNLLVAARIVADTTGAGEPLKYVESITDITEFDLTRTALSEANESLTQAISAYELGLADFDPINQTMQVSAEFERMVGAPIGSISGDPAKCRALLLPEDVEPVMTEFFNDVRSKVARRTLNMTIRRPDGEIRNLQGMIRYRYSETRRLQRGVAIVMDVTEQLRDREAAAAKGERLLEMQAELSHASRLGAMGEMAAALAHELNQPLTAVGTAVGAINIILGSKAGPIDERRVGQIKRAATHAEAQAVRAGEIVRRLREFISRGETDTRREALRELIADAVALALPNPKATGIVIKSSFAREAAHVLANRTQVQQVIVNLVRNAGESMSGQDEPKILSIEVTAVGGMAMVRVADTGPGIEPGFADKLFSPFMSSKSSGMGMGLSISRRIIEAHGGRLWFEPGKGRGADFRFTLPLFPDDDLPGEGGGA